MKKVGITLGSLIVIFISAIYITGNFYIHQTISNPLPIVKSFITETLHDSSVTGITMFRGNKTRTSYGTGPIPFNPSIAWRYPDMPLCGNSTASGITKLWCGNGWTGQPVVWERPDGITELIFGAYDYGIHFVNAMTGKETRPTFKTGDIIKGSVTLDPDGYPLLYNGSRDNFYRIIALDRDTPTELWKVEAKVSDGVWNDDWDGNGIIEDDYLYEGSENGIFHIFKLNRSYDASGHVTVHPIEVAHIPTFSNELIRLVGDRDLSIESSPLKVGDTVYIANSGGRIMGFDVSNIAKGEVKTVFDFWTGDDTDATLVADDEGYIYAVSELQRFTQRGALVGQIMKLNPRNMANPLVWGVPVPSTIPGILGGVWATPAIYDNYLYVATNPGELLTIDRKTGNVMSRTSIGVHAWSSPNIIDAQLIVGTCQGQLKTFSLSNPASPQLLWSFQLPSKSCIESTPAIWNGNIYFGARDGFIYTVSESKQQLIQE